MCGERGVGVYVWWEGEGVHVWWEGGFKVYNGVCADTHHAQIEVHSLTKTTAPKTCLRKGGSVGDTPAQGQRHGGHTTQ